MFSILLSPLRACFVILVLLIAPVVSTFAQVTLLDENFETGSWSNTTVTASVNQWTISNESCSITNKSLMVYSSDVPSYCVYNDVDDANQIAYRLVNATNMYGLTMQFDWQCIGEYDLISIFDYGRVVYCLAANNPAVAGNWVNLALGGDAGYYYNQATPVNASFNLPAALQNTSFYIGFRWVNDASVSGGLGFVVDNLLIKANPYCTPAYSSGCNSDRITNVTINTLNNTTGCSGAYNLYTTPTTSLNVGSTYTASFTVSGTNPEYLGVWIDFNQNNVFDAAEKVVNNLNFTSFPSTKTANITIPCDAVAGTTRMRVMLNYNANPTNACGSYTWGETEDYVITINPLTTAAAGPDQTVCATSSVFAGNAPSFGTAAWALVSGAGTITTPSSPTSGVTALGIGANTFSWTISNGTCTSTDQVVINRDADPTTSNAGTNQAFCETDNTTLNGNTPVIGTGSWSLVSGTGTITTPSSPTSAVTGLGYGPNVFRWTITNGVCPPSSSDVTITRYQMPTSDAGTDQTFCETANATLNAATPPAGTGVWTLTSGTGVITDPSDPASTVTGLSYGANVFTWTVSNGTCTPATSSVTLTRHQSPTTANAGPAQTFCETFNTSFAANAPAIGTGSWSLISGAGTITNPSDPSSAVTALGYGPNVFRWSITNGSCPSSTSDVTITNDRTPSTSVAGPDQIFCESTTASLAANAPAVGSGTWTLVSGSGSITNTADPATGVTGLAYGASVFKWTISNGTCTPSESSMTITREQSPTTSDAGADQAFCETDNAALNGNVPVTGAGTWTLVSGTGVITDPSDPSTTVTGLGYGANVFRWSIVNGTCPSSVSDVTVTRDKTPTAASAGPDQTLCSATATLAANSPVTGSGLWSVISGGGTVTSPSDPASNVTGLTNGANVFRWTISNGTCPASSSDVTVTREETPPVANAGADQFFCETDNTVLAGNASAPGTGVWTLVSGIGTITDPSDPNSSVTGLAYGPAVFRWTISGVTCPLTFDDVTITRQQTPDVANAGPDQTFCETDSYTMQANSPSAGNGTWTLISGSGTITNANSATTNINALGYGPNVFRWTIDNGTCPSNFSDMTITRDKSPDVANAGTNQAFCETDNTLLNANAPSTGTGTWTLVSGSGTITDASVPNSGVTSLAYGANVFQWTITNGICPASSSQVTITRDQTPTVANAGPNQTFCETAVANLNGNNPVIGTGSWTLQSGAGFITAPNNPGSSVNTLGYGSNTFRWTVSNGSCPSTSSTVVITRNQNPTVANAGPDEDLCEATATVLNGNTPTVGIGTWSLISGSGTIASPTDPASAVSSLGYGPNIFRWTITNGNCTPSNSFVTITRYRTPTASSAGPNTTICSASSVLAGNTPVTGTGSWTVVSGGATVTDPSDPNSAVNGLSFGTNIFRWTISNGNCPSSESDVSINRDLPPSAANAGPDQSICSDVTNLSANVPVTGTGMWTLVSGTGAFSDASSPVTSVNGITVGTSTFRWSVTNGTCPPSTDDVDVIRLGTLTAGNAGPNQRICYGGNTTLNLNGFTPGALIQWQDSSVLSAAWTDIPAEINSSIIVAPTATTFYRAKVSNGICPDTYSPAVQVTVDQLPIAGSVTGDQTVCRGSAVTVQLSGYNGSIQWQSSPDKFSISDSAGQNSAALLAAPQFTRYFRAKLMSGVCNPAYSAWVKITVDQPSAAGTINGQDTVCFRDTALLALTGYNGAIQWQRSSDNFNFLNISNQTSGTVKVAPASTEYYRVYVRNGVCPAAYSSSVKLSVIPQLYTGTVSANAPVICRGTSAILTISGQTGNIQWQEDNGSTWADIGTGNDTMEVSPAFTKDYRVLVSNGICVPVYSNVIRVTVVPNAVSDSLVNDTAVCLGGSAALTLKYHTGFMQWQQSADMLSGWSDIPSAVNPGYLTPGLTARTYYRVIVTNGICSDTSNTVTVDVLPAAEAGSISPGSSICAGSSIVLNTTGFTGSLQWQISSDGVSFTDMGTATSASVTVSPLTSAYYRVIAVNGLCTDTSAVSFVKVDPMPVAGAVTAPALTHCKGSATVLSLNGSSGSIQWEESPDGLSFYPVNAASSNTLSVSPVNTMFYRAKLSSGSCGSVYSNIIQLTVTPGSLPGVLSASSSSVCQGGQATLLLNGSLGAVQWQYSINGLGPWNNITGASPDSILLPTITTDYFYRAVVKNGNCAAGISNVIQVRAIPGVQAGFITALSDTICNGNSTLLSLKNSVGNVKWQEKAGGIWKDISGAGYLNYMTPALTGDALYRAYVYNNYCSDTTGEFFVKVEPLPSGGSVVSEISSICEGENVTVSLQGYLGKIQWQQSFDNVTFSDIPNEKSPVLTITGKTSAYYRARVSSTNTVNCNEVYSNNYYLSVIPSPKPGIVYPSVKIRPGSPATVFVMDAEGTVQWQESSDGENFTDVNGSNSAAYSVVPEKNMYYRVKVSNGQCVAYSEAASVVVMHEYLRLSPVPARDHIIAGFTLYTDEVVDIRIFDMMGKEVFIEESLKAYQGYNQFRIDISRLKKGVYYIRIPNSTNLTEGKFIKEE